MPRQARLVIPGLPHHITRPGNNRQDVFFVDSDRRFYLETLREQCEKQGIRVLGYCLMTNHVHLVATPSREDSLTLAIGRTHFVYTQYINRLHQRSGHLWQRPFHSCPTNDAHALHALRYIERNPVRARMARIPWRYRWSIAAAHAGERSPAPLLDTKARHKWPPTLPWKELLTQPDDPEIQAPLRLNTRTGRPLANDSLLSKLEHKLGRRLRPAPVGRPKKMQAYA